MITGITISLTRQTFAQLAELIALTQVLELGKRKRVAIYIISPSICHEVMGPDVMILVF